MIIGAGIVTAGLFGLGYSIVQLANIASTLIH